MRILPGNAQHIGARHSQQDSFGFADPDDQKFLAHGGFLAVVCDGMGGMEQGDAASRAAVRAFLDAYRRKTPEESIPAALERGVREANQEVVGLAGPLGLIENMGTTLVAAAITSDSLYYISVGDSALFLVNGGAHRGVQDSQMRMLNRPHVFANLLDNAVARGVMSRAEAEHHPERESLTSYIGAEELEEIDRNVEPIPLQKNDTVLLATDGMFKTLEPYEMAACLTGTPRSWPDALVARTLAKQHEHQDNVTVLSVSLQGDNDPASSPDLTRTVLIAPSGPPAAPPPVQPAPPPLVPPQHVPSQHVPPQQWTPPVQEVRPGDSTIRIVLPRRQFVATMLIVAAIVIAAGAAAAWQWYARHKALHAVTVPPPSAVPARAPGPPDVAAPPAASSSATPHSGTPQPAAPKPAATYTGQDSNARRP